ncbi:MAG: hypothetical protein FJX74_05010 [Armatimonadetes bacterium]|nr:hypothetical protein [Armatimonadota bacterium]
MTTVDLPPPVLPVSQLVPLALVTGAALFALTMAANAAFDAAVAHAWDVRRRLREANLPDPHLLLVHTLFLSRRLLPPFPWEPRHRHPLPQRAEALNAIMTLKRQRYNGKAF